MEISRMVESPDNIRKDMGDALELAREHFKSKYLRRIQKAVEYERTRTLANPPREVALLAALKEFTPPENHERFDKMAELFITLSSWQEIRHNLELSKQSYATVQAAGMPPRRDESVHRDGVYDIDPECVAKSRYNGGRLAEMMFLLSMLNK